MRACVRAVCVCVCVRERRKIELTVWGKKVPIALDGIRTCISGIRAHSASDCTTTAGTPPVSRNKHFRHSPVSSIVKQSCMKHSNSYLCVCVVLTEQAHTACAASIKQRGHFEDDRPKLTITSKIECRNRCMVYLFSSFQWVDLQVHWTQLQPATQSHPWHPRICHQNLETDDLLGTPAPTSDREPWNANHFFGSQHILIILLVPGESTDCTWPPPTKCTTQTHAHTHVILCTYLDTSASMAWMKPPHSVQRFAIIPSTEALGIYCARGALAVCCVCVCVCVCERERERERETEVTSRSLRWIYTFPCQKFALCFFLFKWSPFCHWNSQWVHTFRCQETPHSLFRLSQMAWHVIEELKTNDQNVCLPRPWPFFPSKKWIKLIPKTIGNRKGERAWGCSRW